MNHFAMLSWNWDGDWAARFDRDCILVSALVFIIAVGRPLAVRFVFEPIARQCLPRVTRDVMKARSRLSRANVAFILSLPKDDRGAAIEKLSREKDMAPRLLSSVCKRAMKETKFTESLFRLFIHAPVFAWTLSLLVASPFFYDTRHCWMRDVNSGSIIRHDLPSTARETLSAPALMLYLFQLSIYLYKCVAHFFETRHSDFLQMFAHHILTCLLLSGSLYFNCTRIGALVLVCHDLSDVFLEVAKLLNYSKRQKLCDVTFIVFAASFILSRLVYFPWVVLHSVAVHSIQALSPFRHRIFFGLLLALQCLHVAWATIIVRMVYKFVITGKVAKDDRSDSENEES